MSILRRHLAPLGDKAWEQIDQEARRVLTANLAARRVVDVKGPLGFDASAVNLGRVSDWEGDRVRFAHRRVLPLVEMRVAFTVSQAELDNLERGADAVDHDPVREAALAAANFEERAIFHGLEAAGMRGMIAATEHPPVALGDSGIEALSDRVAAALIRLLETGVEGPYLLVLGEKLYRAVSGDVGAYPLRQALAKLVGTPPLFSPGLDGGLLVSTRGGDFELTLGIDMSIGFDRAEGDTVHLFLTETFAFRVLGGEALVVLTS
jgi:uncharacterized linocin/CFP29 family protein